MSFAVCAVVGVGLHPAAASPQDAVRLTLDEVTERALAANPSLAAARARAGAADAGADGAGAFLWPSLTVDAGAVRTNDPVAVFGSRLRTGTFSEEDFALDRLVDPDAVTDWSVGAGLQWGVMAPARWAARTAARAEAEAARFTADRASQAAAYGARLLWIEAAEADEAVSAAIAAERAATATASVVRRRRDEGLLTDADVLRAEAAVASARATRILGEQRIADTRIRLAAHLGYPPGTRVEPVGGLAAPPAPSPPGAPSSSRAVRADIVAAERRVDAAHSRERAAQAARLPSADLFGGLTRYAPEAFGGGRTRWSAGVQVHLPVFTGFSTSADIRRARALSQAAQAEFEARSLEAAASIEEARGGVRSAEAAHEAAASAAQAASEALRLTRRRFEEGLATTADVLQAQAFSSDASASAVTALGALHRAAATLAFVTPMTLVAERGVRP